MIIFLEKAGRGRESKLPEGLCCLAAVCWPLHSRQWYEHTWSGNSTTPGFALTVPWRHCPRKWDFIHSSDSLLGTYVIHWGKQNSNKNLYFIIYGAFLPACWGSFEVMLFLFWEFFNRDLCLHVWFAEGIFKLNSHLAPVLHWVLASHEWVAKELRLGTWDWLWFLDLLAEWLLLSP